MTSATNPFVGASAKRVDLLLAKLGIVVAVLLLGLQLFATQPLLLVIPLAIGTGSGLYLLSHRRRVVGTGTAIFSGRLSGYLPALVFVGLAAVVVTTRLAGARTLPVHLLTGAVGALIIGQILFVDEAGLAPGAILVEILVAAVVIRLSVLFVTPGFIGVDIWTHALVFVDGIASQGSLEGFAGSKYVMAPVYHVIGAVGAMVFGSARMGIYLTIGIIVPLATVFIYSTTKFFVPARLALLATALFAFADQVIRWGLHVIPTSLGLAFFLGLVYLVMRVFDAGAERWAVLLALGMSLAVVFTHQVSTAIVLVFLGIAALVARVVWLVDPVDGGPNLARTAGALVGVFGVTLVTTLVSWAYTPFGDSETFLWRELGVLRRALTEGTGFLNLAGGGAATGGGTAGAWFVPYLELLGFTLLLAIAIVGGLLLLRGRQRLDRSLTIVLVGATLFCFVFGLSLFGFRALLPGRWLAFLFVPMVVLAAAGVFHLSQSGSRGVVLVVLVVLTLGYPTSMAVAEKATLDSPAFGDQHTRFAYTSLEISAVNTISEIRPGPTSGGLWTDHPYDEVFAVVGGYEDEDLLLGADGPVGTDATVVREYQSEHGFRYELAPDTSSLDSPGALVCPGRWNKVYANDDVRYCTSPLTEGDR